MKELKLSDEKLLRSITLCFEEYGMLKFHDQSPAMDTLQRIKDAGYTRSTGLKALDKKQWGDKFETFLVDKHSQQYHGCDDDMPDDYNNWLQNLEHDDIINYIGEFSCQHFGVPDVEWPEKQSCVCGAPFPEQCGCGAFHFNTAIDACIAAYQKAGGKTLTEGA